MYLKLCLMQPASQSYRDVRIMVDYLLIINKVAQNCLVPINILDVYNLSLFPLLQLLHRALVETN